MQKTNSIAECSTSDPRHPRDSDAVAVAISGDRDRSRDMRFCLGKDVGGISEASDVRANESANACAGRHCGSLSGGGMHGAQSTRRSLFAIEIRAKGVAKKEIRVLGTGDNLVAR